MIKAIFNSSLKRELIIKLIEIAINVLVELKNQYQREKMATTDLKDTL